MKPECSEWSVWEGPEVEGDFDRGVKTLFVRSGFNPIENDDDLWLLKKYKRVWFCAEYYKVSVINWVARFTPLNVCYELNAAFTKRSEIDPKVKVYAKVNLGLLEGDQICVGPPYKDESFVIGKGQKVSPQDYSSDRRIK